MKYLLDTHVLLWALKGVNADNSEFPTEIKNFFLNEQNDIFYSCVNIYDWLLLSQAKSEGMKFITHDSKLKEYLEECIVSF